MKNSLIFKDCEIQKEIVFINPNGLVENITSGDIIIIQSMDKQINLCKFIESKKVTTTFINGKDGNFIKHSRSFNIYKVIKDENKSSLYSESFIKSITKLNI